MSGLPFPGIGIVFNIDELGCGFYGYQAWRIFMKRVAQGKIRNTVLKEGDTSATLAGKENEFCIALYGPLLNPEHFRKIFEPLTDKGLVPLDRRFIAKPALDDEPLPVRGRIDLHGYFVTDEWTRVDHDLCKEAHWKYRPGKIPDELPENLVSELKKMME
jgi:hypothetical protein